MDQVVVLRLVYAYGMDREVFILFFWANIREEKIKNYHFFFAHLVLLYYGLVVCIPL